MNAEFIEALKEIAKSKEISEDFIFTTLEDALIAAYKKNYSSKNGEGNQNVVIEINRETGENHIYARKNIVESVENDVLEISLEDAKKIDPRYEVGEVVNIEVTPKDFGRVAAQSARQVVIQRIKEAERANIYNYYIQKEHDLITGTVLRKDKNTILLNLDKIETVLGPNEQIPGEDYKFNEQIKLYVVEVKNTTNGAKVVVSRTHKDLVKRLFEFDVPEIFVGTVEIKSIA